MSSFVHLNRIHFSFDNLGAEVISDLSHRFHPGWTSICGSNGTGKSTLLRLIAGQLQPHSGTIDRQGSLVAVEQSTEHPPVGLEAFRWDFSRVAIKCREDLAILDEWFDRWHSLSIGERKRLQLATALSCDPDVLLIDEPTNHVDARTRHRILSVLQKFRGVGILVSHDRLLLNELCTQTSFLENGELTCCSAPHDQAKILLDSDQHNRRSHKDRLKKEQSRLARSTQLQAEKIAQGRKKLSKRGISAKDHDAKEKIHRARLFGADLADSRKKDVLAHRSQKLSEDLEKLHTKKSRELGIFFTKVPRTPIIHLKESRKDFEYIEISYPDIVLRGGDKLALVGDNGAGKTTLLRSWLQELPIGFTYAPQEFLQEEAQKLTANLLELDADKRSSVLTLISCLGSNPKSIAAGSPPSPGVWQKIMIARAIVEASPILILDEPTNHMDLPSLGALEKALGLYRGIIICISHDRDFIDNVCNLQLELRKQEMHTTCVLTHIEKEHG